MKNYNVEQSDEGIFDIWSYEGNDPGGELVASIYDLELAERIVDLLNAFVSNGLDEDEYDDDLDDDDDYGEAVDEFIARNEHTYTDWDEENK